MQCEIKTVEYRKKNKNHFRFSELFNYSGYDHGWSLVVVNDFIDVFSVEHFIEHLLNDNSVTRTFDNWHTFRSNEYGDFIIRFVYPKNKLPPEDVGVEIVSNDKETLMALFLVMNWSSTQR